MNVRLFTFCSVVLLVCCGCEHLKRVEDDSRYFGGFIKGYHYSTRGETILTRDVSYMVYGGMTFPPKRLFLVPADTGAATNYVRGKFAGLKSAKPVHEIGRLPNRAKLEFVGADNVVVMFEPPGPAIPIARILEGPFKGNEVCIYHLCADEFRWGWPQHRGNDRLSDLGNGRQIQVFAPSATYLVAEPQ